MSAVFLSYKRDVDAERASVVRTKLEALGMDIFQDVDMSAGTGFHGILHSQISAAAAVLVLWTKMSIQSRWVSAEAQKALDFEKLVAVTFDRIMPRDMPMPFNGIQTPDLSDWIETGAKADHPGWRSVLKALGVLFNRPFQEIARILEAGTPDSKADFIRKYPNDPFAAGLARELTAAKLYEFEQQANRVKHLGEKRLADEIRRLNKLRSEFVDLVDGALISGTYNKLDVQQEIYKTLNPYDAEIGGAGMAGRKRKTLVEEIARMKSELGILRNSVTAAEGARAEIADIATQLRSQLETITDELRDSENLSESARAEIDRQRLEIADLEKQTRQTSRPPIWVMTVAAILGAGVMWLAFDIFNPRSDLISAAVAHAEQQKIQNKLDDARTRLDAANITVDTLGKDKKQLSDQLNDARTKLVAANSAAETLGKDKKLLSDQLIEARNKLGAANTALDAFGSEKKQLSDQLDDAKARLVTANGAANALSTDKKQLLDQLNDTKTRLATANTAVDAANTRVTSLSQQLATASAMQNADASRAASEARCNELAAYESDSDLPRSAKRPLNPNKIPPSTAQEVIDNCLAALSTIPKETSRRVLLQLSRGYILQGHAARQTDQTSATYSYSIAVSLAGLASRLGSSQAEMILGYIFSGGFNVPRLKYVLPNTPDYLYAWERFEASANAQNPFGLLYAGSYLMFPGCSQNTVASVPEKGLQYLRQAQEKKIAAAYYAEGYYWYFGAPGVQSDPSRGRSLFERARQMDFAEADAFLGKSPPKQDTCPRVIF